ncbi:MAG: hypothetical protein GX033_06295 [Firmicutes bacterium]|nr:hypothetical protein [Bacillota bacterium]
MLPQPRKKNGAIFIERAVKLETGESQYAPETTKLQKRRWMKIEVPQL